MKRRWIVCAGLFGTFLSASALLAKPGIVKTRDGRSLEGDVTEKQDGVVVTLRGIPTNIARENIESVQYVGNIDEQYKEKLAALPKTPSAKDHLELARWLFDAKAYTLARKETDAALAIDPNNTEANTLYTTIQGQLRLEQSRPAVGTGTGTGPKPPNGTNPKPPVAGATTTSTGTAHTASMHKYLSAEQINLLKQAEWSPDDTSIKINFVGDVKRKYLASAQP